MPCFDSLTHGREAGAAADEVWLAGVAQFSHPVVSASALAADAVVELAAVIGGIV